MTIGWPRGTLVGLAAVLATLLPHTDAGGQYDPPPAPGPYYFVSDQLGATDQFFWRAPQHFGGIKTIPNYNLLAAVLGDDPASLLQPGQELVAPATYGFGGGSVDLQPFAFTTAGDTKAFNLPLGPRLRSFLNDPLGGARFDLTLPFSDPNVALSFRSAVIRSGDTEAVWHNSVDLDVNGNTDLGFDVVAPADGTVEGTTATSSSLAIRHTASNGRPFLTIYQHLVPESKAHLQVGTAVRRGDVLGHVQEPGYTHLHFALAVRGPSRTVNGVVVPEMWYLLDSFGVYDYRRNIDSSTTYNYLPSNTLLPPVRGVIHAYAWRTDPPVGSLLLPEDCVGFNPNTLAIQASGSTFRLVDGSHVLFSFPNLPEATAALGIIRQYRANRSCFVGRPDPSFSYLLVGTAGPAGAVSGEDCLAFNPSAIRIEALSGGQYRMVSGSQAMFVFPGMLEAGNALSAIRKHGFTRTCFVGRPDPSLQYMRREAGATGTFEVSPGDAAVAVRDRLDYEFTWTVPTPRNWHDLATLDLRVRDHHRTILWVRFDEASQTFSVFDDDARRFRRGAAAGSRRRLETPLATVHLADTTVLGSGPTGPSVTLTLALSFKRRTATRTYVVEVKAMDDLGHHDAFARAGFLTVKPAQAELDDGPEGDAEETEP
jgi:murein DD-endopeptidase MepM/ murein hydrolase activator NlpD